MATSVFGGRASDSITFAGGSVLDGPTANEVDLANGTNAQTLKIFKTTDGAGNDEEIAIGYNAATTTNAVVSAKTGTGTARALGFGVGDDPQWRISTSGNLETVSDGVGDIGTHNHYPDTIRALTDMKVGPTASTKSVTLGMAAGYLIARGATALDGSNPTPVATGLTTIVAAVAAIKRTSAVSTGTAVVTCDFTGSDGTLDLYGWIIAGTASSGTETVEWIAIGT